jgi:hypothetical protein
VEAISRTDTTMPTCATWAQTLHSARLQVATSTYEGSNLQASCRYLVCRVRNQTNLDSTCTFGASDANICVAPTTAASSSAFVAVAGALVAAVVALLL